MLRLIFPGVLFMNQDDDFGITAMCEICEHVSDCLDEKEHFCTETHCCNRFVLANYYKKTKIYGNNSPIRKVVLTHKIIDQMNLWGEPL